MDCCSLEGRTLKTVEVVRHLSEFVLVMLKPLTNPEDKKFAESYGVKKFPCLLILNPQGNKVGTIGNASSGEIVKFLKKVLDRT